MVLTSEPIANKSKRGVQLLTEYPIPPLSKPLHQPTNKPRPCERPRKRSCTENKVEQEGFIEVEALN